MLSSRVKSMRLRAVDDLGGAVGEQLSISRCATSAGVEKKNLGST